MARAEIQVLLGGGAEEGGMMRYEPGAELWGMVQVVPDGDVRCSHLWARLQWHTEGRGTRDEGKVAEVDLFQGPLTGKTPASYEFRFPLPREPWSYAGHYVSIVWEIAVDVDVPWSVNPRASQPFIMAPSLQAGAVVADTEPRFDVTLTSYGSRLIDVGKAVLSVMPYLDVQQAAKMITDPPVKLMVGVSEQLAEDARAKLEAAGTVVEVTPASGR